MKKADYLTAQEEQEDSEALVAEDEWAGEAEDDVTAICEMMRAMDFTVEQPFRTVLGVGRIWERDWVHVGVERDRYKVLNSDEEWETVLELQYEIPTKTLTEVFGELLEVE